MALRGVRLMFELPSFFNSKLEPWIGKVVSQKAQKFN